MKRGKRINPVNKKKRAKRWPLKYGSEERVIAINELPCLCGGNHPACAGPTQNAHRVSKAVLGTWRDVLAMSAGCHRWQGDHGFAAWENAAGLEQGAAELRAAELAEQIGANG